MVDVLRSELGLGDEVTQRLAARLDAETAVGVADRELLAVDRCDRDSKLIRVDLGELRDVVCSPKQQTIASSGENAKNKNQKTRAYIPRNMEPNQVVCHGWQNQGKACRGMTGPALAPVVLGSTKS